MPASEDFFRDQKKLHVVFFLSALGMFGATVWMLANDHLKPWKKYQREFIEEVSRNRLDDELAVENRQLDRAKLADLDLKIDKAKADLAGKQDEIAKLQADLQTERLKLDKQEQVVQFGKAGQAELMSKFDLIVAEMGHAEPGSKRYQKLEAQKKAAEGDITRIDATLLAASGTVDEYKKVVNALQKQIADSKTKLEDLETERSKLTTDRDSLQRSVENANFDWKKKVRSLPIIDGFASAVKVQQVALDELPIDYNFKMVTRYDRCMTCHLGIDKTGFTAENGVRQPYCSHPHQDLYVLPKSKHPVDKFGCTICHQGQGTATSFDWASHTPQDSKQMAEWTKEKGWFFNHFHELPMYPKRFIEASCAKCHHDPYQIPEAKKLLLGYKTVRTYGCYGCHEIDGYKDDGTSVGPNLRLASEMDNDFDKKQALRKVGPSLVWASEKLTPEFTWKWIRDPQAFRPSTKMPLFYKQIDTGFFGDMPHGEFDASRKPEVGNAATGGTDHAEMLKGLAVAEIHGITQYLTVVSKKATEGKRIPEVKGTGDKVRGNTLFESKGCVACHVHKDHPQAVGDPDKKGFGPELSEVGAKFTSAEQKKWLSAWIKNPTSFNAESYMPNLQLADQDVVDIAAYLTSVPGKWAKELTYPAPQASADAVRDLLVSFEGKGKGFEQAKKEVGEMAPDMQLFALGQKTIARLGCFGCHNIPGFEKAKPIGVGLADWGRKDPHKLAFENVVQYIDKSQAALPEAERANSFYVKNDYFKWALDHHQREGFLMQKLREPRSYDYEKIRKWEDRTRMPQFTFSDEEREAVATLVLGLVGETINRKYVYNPPPAKKAEVLGRNRLELYNCTACHVIKPGEYRVTPAESDRNNLIELSKKELANDYGPELDKEYPHSKDDAWSVPKDKINKGDSMVCLGLPDGEENPDEAEDSENPRAFMRLWEATSVKGEVVPSGVKVAYPLTQRTAAYVTPPYGGNYALSLVEYLVKKSANPANPAERDRAWQQGPPPLIREGRKVQTTWLYSFLREPVMIRPGAILRMPKFNFLGDDVESLANYFAAAEEVAYPYIQSPEKESAYLEPLEQKFPHYLESGFKLITNKELCIKCHPVGGVNPAGKPEELGPSLVRAQERLRPEWMLRWISNPKRFVPYTQMPVNFLKDKKQYQEIFNPPTSFDQAKAARDALVNYNTLVDRLMNQKQAQAKPAENKPAEGKGGME